MLCDIYSLIICLDIKQCDCSKLLNQILIAFMCVCVCVFTIHPEMAKC